MSSNYFCDWKTENFVFKGESPVLSWSDFPLELQLFWDAIHSLSIPGCPREKGCPGILASFHKIEACKEKTAAPGLSDFKTQTVPQIWQC